MARSDAIILKLILILVAVATAYKILFLDLFCLSLFRESWTWAPRYKSLLFF